MKNQIKYNVLDNLKIKLNIDDNKFNISPEELFLMAARKNKKRSFLFVSNVLGKHIPVDPKLSILVGKLLGNEYMKKVFEMKSASTSDIVEVLNKRKDINEIYENTFNETFDLPEKTLFIGFAETATALAHSVFSSFKSNAYYIHTTREEILDYESPIKFEEEHSHATAHNLYPIDFDIIDSDSPIVFIDDEITTGKTTLNIIEAIHKKYPRKNYTIISILDWRKEEDKLLFKEMENRLNVTIETISLLTGNIEIQEDRLSNLEINNKVENINSKDPNIETVYLDLNSESFMRKTKKFEPYFEYSGRFGMDCTDNKILNEELKQKGHFLKTNIRKGKNTLCMGTGEFMYIPMVLSTYLGDGVKYQSTTRSPIYPFDKTNYGARNVFKFDSLEDKDIKNYFYNIPKGFYDEMFLFLEREFSKKKMESLVNVIKTLEIKNVNIVIFQGRSKTVNTEITPMGSYKKEDAVFLLKDISKLVEEQGNAFRELAIQSGVHYSEMLPIEYKPSDEYIELFYESLEKFKKDIAIYVGVVSEMIIKNRGKDIVLASLARAGTPIGVLIKRYIKFKYNLDVPHYSISIIRGKGLDENAIKYIILNHPNSKIQFVDGWTGKGAINTELNKTCCQLNKKMGVELNSDLAVIADPGYLVNTFGTRKDFLIPSACLNSTVSGLVSRTVLRDDLIGEDDFHGAKFYKELINEDLSNYYIDKISENFDETLEDVKREFEILENSNLEATLLGLEDVNNIKNEFNVKDINFIKPGIGETTRVLLRRIPWKILVKNDAKNIDHIIQLAKEKNIEVMEYDLKSYECCGIIKPVSDQ